MRINKFTLFSFFPISKRKNRRTKLKNTVFVFTKNDQILMKVDNRNLLIKVFFVLRIYCVFQENLFCELFFISSILKENVIDEKELFSIPIKNTQHILLRKKCEWTNLRYKEFLNKVLRKKITLSDQISIKK